MFEKVNPSPSWAVVEGFPDYRVSDNGRVYSMKRDKELRQYDKNGYLYVFLYDGCGKRKAMLVHRLVAMAFVGNPDGLPQINHKDENPANNNAENLEWCTARYNSNYGHRNERLSKANGGENNPFYGKKHTPDEIAAMRAAKIGKPSKRRRQVTIDGVVYESVKDAMDTLGICTRALYRKLNEQGC